jgi:hypothetical protein
MRDASSDDSASGIDRRSVLKTVGATGLAATVGVGSTVATSGSGDEDETPDTETTDLSGSRERKAVADALSDDDFSALVAELADEGASKRPKDANAFTVAHTDDDIEYTVVVLPFAADDAHNAYALFCDSAYVENTAVYVGRPSESGVKYRVTTYTVGGDDVVSTERELTPSEVREFKREIQPESHGDFTTQGFPTCNVNFECVGTAAAKAGVLFGACASCANGFLPACAACAGSGIQFVNTDCSLCK